MDLVNCIWVVRLHNFGTTGIITYTPFVPNICATWIVWIVYGFCQLYFDCKIVLELYDCGIWHRGCRIESIVFGLC